MQNDLMGGGAGGAPDAGAGDPNAGGPNVGPGAPPPAQSPMSGGVDNIVGQMPMQPAGQKPMPTRDDLIGMQNKQSKIDLALHKLLSSPGPIARKKVVDTAVELVSEKVMSAQAMAQLLVDLPEDPQEIRQWVQRHATEVEQHIKLISLLSHGSEPLRPLGEPIPPEEQEQQAAVAEQQSQPQPGAPQPGQMQ